MPDDRIERVEVERLESAGEVEAAEWGALAAGRSVYASRPWHLLAERRPGVRTYCVAARDLDGRVRAILPVGVYYRRPTPSYDPLHLFAEAVADASEESWYPLVLVGPRAGFLTESLVDPLVPSAERARLLKSLYSDVLAREERLGARAALVPYVRDADADALTAALAELAPVRVFTTWEAELACPRGLDSYIASFRAGRRAKIRREMRAFGAAGSVVRTTRLSEAVDEIAPLVAGLQARYGDPMPISEVTGYLRAQAAQLDDVSLVLLCERAGATAACAVFYVAGTAFHARLFGGDRSSACDYFNLAFYEAVRCAASVGAESIHYGPGSLEAKTYRGAHLNRLWSIVLPVGDGPPGLARLAETRSGRPDRVPAGARA